jgi:putative cell wall-binding protein
MVLTSFTINASAAEVNSDTILGGSNRFETAIKISENGWSTSDRAVLINGEKGLVDALTATPYAYAKNAPILITAPGKLTPATANRLTKMGVKNVDVVGGTNSVSEGVVTELKNKGITVNRISGASRYDTSLAVAKEIDKIQDVAQIAVVNGDKGIPDAVSVAAPAASKKMPILLADNNGLNAASKKFVADESVTTSYVIGSTGSVSDAVLNSLPGTKTRLGGADRHDTNAAVIKEFYTATSLSNIYVAKSGRVKTDDEIVDALAAGVLAARNGNPIVLVGNSINASQQTLLASKKFTKLTQIGMGIPTNSVTQIKATQADAEANATSVSVVDYKTIKIKGSNLNLIDKTKVELAGNTVASYTVNSDGTEATVVFNNGFSGSNTVKVTSNLGKVMELTFTYSATISSVQTSTKEVGKEGLQYLEFTVNGSEKRSINELKSLGWEIEFEANQKVFYGGSAATAKDTSEDGKLITSFGETFNTFNYEVTLTKGNDILKSGKGYVDIVDKASQYSSVDSFKLSRNETELSSNTAVVGETLKVTDFKATNKNGTTVEIEDLTKNESVDVKSSNESVISAKRSGDGKNTLTAVSTGSATITVTDGTVKKDLTVQVKEEARKVNSVSLTSSTLYIAASNKGGMTTTINVKDQYGDPFVGTTNFDEVTAVSTTGTNARDIAGVSMESSSNNKGEVSITITPKGDVTSAINAPLAIKTSDKSKTWDTINVYVSGVTEKTSFKVENVDKKSDNNLDVYDTKDNEVVFNINEYNGNYLLKSSEAIVKDTVSTESDEYSVIVSDTDKASIAVLGKDITVKALKDGNVDFKVYFAGTLKNTIRLNIKDSTPTITKVDFKNVDTVTKLDNGTKYDPISEVLDLTDFGSSKIVVGGMTVTGKGGDVEYTSPGDLKVTKTVGSDTTTTNVGKIEVSANFGNNKVTDNKVELISGDKGTITVKIYTKRDSKGKIDTSTSPITKTIAVDMK